MDPRCRDVQSVIKIEGLVDDAKWFQSGRELRWPRGVCCPSCNGSEVTKGPCKNRLRKDGRRAARPARREEREYALVFDRGATQSGGMDRRPDCVGYFCTGP